MAISEGMLNVTISDWNAFENHAFKIAETSKQSVN